MGLNFCWRFVSSILPHLDLAGCYLVQTLLNPPKSYYISFFCEVCLQEPNRAALLIKPFPYNHSISDVRQRDFVKVKAKIFSFY